LALKRRQNDSAWPCACTSTRAIALAVTRKGLAYGDVPGRFNGQALVAALASIIRSWCHAQRLAPAAYRHLSGPLGDVLVRTHRVGWLSLRLEQATD
jgi:hypothetical protein